MKRWYCLRTKLNQERIALNRLRRELGVDCFLPMVSRLGRRSRAGQLVREPLFPGYLFAKVDLSADLRKVKYARGVLDFVQMGERYPSLLESEIEGLKLVCVEVEQVMETRSAVCVGDSIELVGRLFGGTRGTVRELIPARKRARVLIEFLGRAVEVDVDSEGIRKVMDQT
ncbi:transcription termination/antitermination NusG family protein [Pelagicoccus sp. SDUM812002]|uniref:transcription termination/antitermination protein NusG n=1 Tax=Pelagicoccus sp. SDUM812002 TaxID=3041266 RepID=UPI00280D7B8D|nr:transcription termination/antitermination NusG family protein [Pelagicoccus sp. SDUM812002]MDQ8186298.1 transcription termination/antitermination NusG family protein [Pelagicoccus sp. SDUM812002]